MYHDYFYYKNNMDEYLTDDQKWIEKEHPLSFRGFMEQRAMNAVCNLNGALEDMPNCCITIGFYEIMQARKIRLGCFRDWHRGVIRQAVYGKKTPRFPVSLLQDHPNINIRMTDLVADLPE